MLREHDRVALATGRPADGLKAGDAGSIVHVYRGGEAFEVEFVMREGEATALVTLTASQVSPAAR